MFPFLTSHTYLMSTRSNQGAAPAQTRTEPPRNQRAAHRANAGGRKAITAAINTNN
jgi:hypothetical protein